MFVQQAQTSDTLEYEFSKQIEDQPFQNMQLLYQSDHHYSVLSAIMSKLSFEKPLQVCRLLEQLEDENDKIDQKVGLLSSDKQNNSLNAQQWSSCQQINLRVKEKSKGNSNFMEKGNRNVFEQHRYDSEIIPNLLQVYEISSLRNKQEEQSFQQQQSSSHFVKEISIVSASISSVDILLQKISFYRGHSSFLINKLKQKTFNIDKLYITKQNKKNYLQQILNVKKLVVQKVQITNHIDQQTSNQQILKSSAYWEKQLCNFRTLQSLIVKYQYVPYVFLYNMLQKKMFSILQERIQHKVETRFMNLSIEKMIEVWKRLLWYYLPKATQQNLTLSTLTNNLLRLIIYVKTDSFESSEESSSKHLKSEVNLILTQKYIEYSLKRITSLVTFEQFQKISSMMQFSQLTREIYSKWKYVWISIFNCGIRRVSNLTKNIFEVNEKETQCQHMSFNKKRDNHEGKQQSEQTFTIMNKCESLSYGKVGQTVQTIKQLLTYFDPKFQWVWQYLCSKSLNHSTKEMKAQSPLFHLVKSLFNKSIIYQENVKDDIQQHIVYQAVFGKKDCIQAQNNPTYKKSQQVKNKTDSKKSLQQIITQVIRQEEQAMYQSIKRKQQQTKSEQKKKSKSKQQSKNGSNQSPIFQEDATEQQHLYNVQFSKMPFKAVQRFQIRRLLSEVNMMKDSLHCMEIKQKMNHLENQAVQLVSQYVNSLKNSEQIHQRNKRNGSSNSEKLSQEVSFENSLKLQRKIVNCKDQTEQISEVRQFLITITKITLELVIEHSLDVQNQQKKQHQKRLLCLVQHAQKTKLQLKVIQTETSILRNCMHQSQTIFLQQLMNKHTQSHLQNQLQLYSNRLNELILSFNHFLDNSNSKSSKKKPKSSSQNLLKQEQKKTKPILVDQGKLETMVRREDDLSQSELQISHLIQKNLHLIVLLTQQVKALKQYEFIHDAKKNSKQFQQYVYKKMFLSAMVCKILMIVTVLEKKIFPKIFIGKDKTKKVIHNKYHITTFNETLTQIGSFHNCDQNLFQNSKQILLSQQIVSQLSTLLSPYFGTQLKNHFESSKHPHQCQFRDPKLSSSSQPYVRIQQQEIIILSQQKLIDAEKQKKKKPSKISSFVGSIFGRKDKKKDQIKSQNDKEQKLKTDQKDEDLNLKNKQIYQNYNNSQVYECGANKQISHQEFQSHQQFNGMNVQSLLLLILKCIKF